MMNVTPEYEAALKVVENQKMGRIPMLWHTEGEFQTASGLRYKQAESHELKNVLNWTDRETLKMDAARQAEDERRYMLKRNPNIK